MTRSGHEESYEVLKVFYRSSGRSLTKYGNLHLVIQIKLVHLYVSLFVCHFQSNQLFCNNQKIFHFCFLINITSKFKFIYTCNTIPSKIIDYVHGACTVPGTEDSAVNWTSMVAALRQLSA